MEELGGKIIDGKYRIEGLIGRGGMGVVYRATQLNLDRPVAVKVIRTGAASTGDAVEQFTREARLIARLRHPNIVTVYDFGVLPGPNAYIVLELLSGRTLRDEILSEGRLDVRRAVRIALGAGAALSAAHKAGIIHRDLKPGNIFIERLDGVESVKLLDFGIAQLRHESGKHDEDTTQAHQVVGTPLYMSPEQCEGLALDARSDIYSLGCAFYHTLTGVPPFSGGSASETMRMHLLAVAPPPSAHVASVTPLLDAILLKALEKKPWNRFATVDDFLESVSALEKPATGALHARHSHADGHAGEDAGSVSLAVPAGRIPRHNLPRGITTFVGRRQESDELGTLILETPAVTLTGPGGVGKTRLALEVAWTALTAFPDGARIVEFASLADSGLVAQLIAEALDVRKEPDSEVADTIVESLRTKSLLLVLDNCEHLVDACARFAEVLLERCPGVRVLATSREPLGIAGETVRVVRPLIVPGEGDEDNPEQLARIDAVRLFVERARLGKQDFGVTARNAATVAAICRRLDGIPLAIELAAARARLLGLDELLSRLEQSIDVIAGGSRGTQPRQQTLRAAIAWSYDLLDDDERDLLERLSVFSGGFTLDAAAFAGRVPDALEVVERLVDKSLVVADEQAGAVRFRMLDTIRRFASELLRASGREPEALARHSVWFLQLAAECEAEIEGPRQEAVYARLQAEIDNFRALLHRASENGDYGMVTRLSTLLMLFWAARGYWHEGRHWLKIALSAEKTFEPETVSGVYYALALIEFYAGNYRDAQTYLDRSLRLARSVGDSNRIASALRLLSGLASKQGDTARALTQCELALGLFRELGDERGAAWALTGIGLIAMDASDNERAAECLSESLGMYRSFGGARQLASTLHNLGEVTCRLGDLGRAESLLGEALAIARDIGDRQLEGYTWSILGNIEIERGDPVRARARFAEGFAICDELGDPYGLATAIEGFAFAAIREGNPGTASTLLGAAAELRRARDLGMTGFERAKLDALRAETEIRMGKDGAGASFEAGRTLVFDFVRTLISEQGRT